MMTDNNAVMESKTAIPAEWQNNLLLTYEEYYQALSVMPETGAGLARKIAHVLESIVQANADMPCARTIFNVSQVPSISVEAYVARIAQYSQCSPEAYILAIIYIDRYHREHGATCLNRLNIHKLIIASIMVAAKFVDDVRLSNKDFAKIGAVSTRELNELELELLNTIGFSIHVKQEEFDCYAEAILSNLG